ncbi:hypothetical protein ART_4033 [Arthrobacter sp. PAMC 25486]|nr:hypothetical protein ART_4033 [Arthrobacter sp. PAMC 25486]
MGRIAISAMRPIALIELSPELAGTMILAGHEGRTDVP